MHVKETYEARMRPTFLRCLLAMGSSGQKEGNYLHSPIQAHISHTLVKQEIGERITYFAKKLGGENSTPL
jgi:hypothetical protein